MITSFASAASFQPSFGLTELEKSPANVLEPETSRIVPKPDRTRQSIGDDTSFPLHGYVCLSMIRPAAFCYSIADLILDENPASSIQYRHNELTTDYPD